VAGEGWHFAIPCLQYPVFFNLSSKNFDFENDFDEKNYRYHLKLSLMYKPIEAKLPFLVHKFGNNYEEIIFKQTLFLLRSHITDTLSLNKGFTPKDVQLISTAAVQFLSEIGIKSEKLDLMVNML